jgi:hypothetical protein
MDAPGAGNQSRVIDVNTVTAEEIEALPEFIESTIFSSDE